MVIPPTVAPEAVEVPLIEVKAGPAQVPILTWCSAWSFLQCFCLCLKKFLFGLDASLPISFVLRPISCFSDVILSDVILADLLLADLLLADLSNGWLDRTLDCPNASSSPPVMGRRATMDVT